MQSPVHRGASDSSSCPQAVWLSVRRAQTLLKAGVKLLAASVRAENSEMIQFILSHNL